MSLPQVYVVSLASGVPDWSPISWVDFVRERNRYWHPYRVPGSGWPTKPRSTDAACVEVRESLGRSVRRGLMRRWRSGAGLVAVEGVSSYDQMLWTGLKKKAAYLPGC